MCFILSGVDFFQIFPHFSRQLRPDLGNSARAAIAGLGYNYG